MKEAISVVEQELNFYRGQENPDWPKDKNEGFIKGIEVILDVLNKAEKVSSDKHFKYCQVHIVGDLKNWDYAYHLSEEEFNTSGEAQEAGLDYLEHDDFIVAEFQNEKCVAVHISSQGRHTEKSEDFGEYVTGINREYGFGEWVAFPGPSYIRQGDYAEAARCYLTFAWWQLNQGITGWTEDMVEEYVGDLFPWDEDFWVPEEDPIFNLSKARDYIAAEIEFLSEE